MTMTRSSNFTRDRRTIGQVIAEVLLERIQSGVLQAGQRLPTQRELMEEFDAGANAVREATQALVMMGVIDVRPGRGAIVLAVPRESVLDFDTVAALLEDQAVVDLLEFRQVVEADMVERASSRATAEDIARIRDAHERFAQVLAEGKSVYAGDIEFHRALAVASHNQVYVDVLDMLGNLLAIARQRTERVAESKEEALVEHDAIYRAVASGDAAAARNAMKKHLRTAMWAEESVRSAP
jgi:GntR family transcriptional regulator, transcriptional repressor for pyruvate dehydrogenase complex